MKTVEVEVYSFDELSEKAKQVAIENYRSNDTEIFWAEENRNSLEKFAEIFPIKITNWSYGRRGEGVDFHFTAEYDEIEELSGIRLAKYIWNNYRDEIYSYKWYNGTQRTKPNKYHKTNPAAPEFTTWSRYSRITIEKYNCPLTGYTMDNELLDEIWKFLDKPDSRNFKDLLGDCFHSWIKACNADIEYQNSDESIIENIKANDYQFTANGKRF